MGTCTRCGCCPEERCELAHLRPSGRLPDDMAAKLRTRVERILSVREHCTMTGSGICSRCAGVLAEREDKARAAAALARATAITAGQWAELERIQDRHGDDVTWERRGGQLVVRIQWRPVSIVIPRR